MEERKIYQSHSFKITITALMTAFTCTGGFIRIPTPLLDITMQTFFACMAGILLGKKLGTLSQFIYAIIGLAGVPIFTRGGGITYVFQPSFGFILGFILCAFLCGLMRDILFKNKLKTEDNKKIVWKDFLKITVICLVGILGLYIVGGSYMLIILKSYLNIDTAVIISTMLSLPLFVLGDLISLIILIIITPVLYRRVEFLLKI